MSDSAFAITQHCGSWACTHIINMQAFPDIYTKVGYSAPIVSLVPTPAEPSHLSAGALAAVIFVVSLIAAIIVVVAGALFTM